MLTALLSMTMTPANPTLRGIGGEPRATEPPLGLDQVGLPPMFNAGGYNGSASLDAAPLPSPGAATTLDLLHGYLGVFVVAFLVTVLATPVMRRLAIANGIIDRPSEQRKGHRIPVAYLGGVAVFFGVLAGIAFSYFGLTLPPIVYDLHPTVLEQSPVPVSILLGMTLIAATGLWDDVTGLHPRLKIAGQLLAAAAMAMENVGTKVAAGVMQPIGRLVGNTDLVFHFDIGAAIPILAPTGSITLDLIYWTGTAIIAVFVLGACNASNLIDGLDGLLSGVTGIAAAALLIVALMMAAMDTGTLDAARVVLCLSLLGACLGFLPHNFNPATIFLGDTGSLLLGYLTIAIILTLGDTGQTHLVVAGLIIYSIPIIDTVLAIVRRKLAGVPMSAPDAQHLHHMLKRALGVKGAVLTMYGFGMLFGGLGIWLTSGRVRVVFTIAMVLAAFIAVTAVKVARREAIEAQALTGPKPRAPGNTKGARADRAKVQTSSGTTAPATPAPVAKGDGQTEIDQSPHPA
ncbi:MAG: glycosyltransferase family 4 protein [Phycisphaerales bacterium]